MWSGSLIKLQYEPGWFIKLKPESIKNTFRKQIVNVGLGFVALNPSYNSQHCAINWIFVGWVKRSEPNETDLLLICTFAGAHKCASGAYIEYAPTEDRLRSLNKKREV